jgi:CRP/FNR family cyclic AMP-dependent transcriptional regulator
MPVKLTNIPLFLGLPENDLRALAAKAVIKTFAKDAIVFSEGDCSGPLYVVLSGKVKVCLEDESGKEVILDTKGPGGYFGEMALDEQPRSATIVTLEPCRFAVFSKADFEHLLLEHPEISQHVIKDLIHVVRGLNKNVQSLVVRNIYGRVSRLLLDLAVEHEGKLVIPEKLTQQDMAIRVGSSRETINRIFRDLAIGGYIKVEGKKITINRALPARW